MIPLLGFSPDTDPTTPGVLLDCENVIPTLRGMKGAPTLATPSGVPPLADECMGAAVVVKLDGTRRVFAATQSKIYEYSSGVWVDVSGASYTGGPEGFWSIAQFGDSTLMANGADKVQRSTIGNFAQITSAPVAKIVFTVGDFVMALNTGAYADQWHCSAAFDDTDWVQSTTTQSASGRLVSTPGELTAGCRLGSYAVAFKKNSVYLGQYVGAPSIWDWRQIIGGNAGCVGQRALCDVDGTLFFVGEDNFWLFDGTRPVPIADGVIRNWFAENCSAQYRYKTTCAYDKTTNLVWVFYPSSNASTLDSAVVYHVLSKKWGRVTASAQAVLEYVSEGVTIDGLDALYATIDDAASIPFDSPYWIVGARTLSVFNESNQLQSFSGPAGYSSITTWETGDDFAFSLFKRMKPRFSVAPTSASMTLFHKNSSGDAFVNGGTSNMSVGRFDALRSARWFKAQIDLIGNHEITGLDAGFSSGGME